MVETLAKGAMLVEVRVPLGNARLPWILITAPSSGTGRRGCGSQGTTRQCEATVDTDHSPFFRYRTGQLDRVRTGGWLHQCESHSLRANCCRLPGQARCDCARHIERRIGGVVRARFYRRRGLAGIDSDAEWLACQLEFVRSADHVVPKLS